MLSAGSVARGAVGIDRLLDRARRLLPRGGALPDEIWRRRHRAILTLLWVHAVGIACYGIFQGYGLAYSLLEGAVVGLAAALASSKRLRRPARAAISSFGLVAASGILVHLSGGYIEVHFHFFVMIAVITLYQDWRPFLIAIGYVVLEHGLGGMFFPEAVYNHPDAWANPWKWALIHGGFVLAESAACIATWRLSEHQALHEPLTNLPNRVLFRNRVEQALARMGRQDGLAAVLYVDLDGFKAVNDTLGHAAGDQLLRAVADRLRACLRLGDTVARLGGDEFGILLEDLRDAEEADLIAERVLDALRAPFTVPGGTVPVGASAGLAVGESARQDAEELIRNADVAMYVAKGRRRGSFQRFEPSMHAAVLERAQLEADLRQATEREEFRLYYQPIVALDGGRITGVEALVRWQHPERGLLPPSEFIPLAEETGLILELERWIIRAACRQARAWQAERPGVPPLEISVNLSAGQFQRPGLVQDVAAVLRETGLQPGSLKLELTESALIDGSEATIGKLRQLRELGARLAIDDFGTGYSSLGYLAHFPVDVLKIDRSFVGTIGSEDQAGALTHAIIELGHTLGLQLVAEGIEHAEQWDRLRALGCDLGQGYYFARPLPPEQIGALLVAERLPSDGAAPAQAA